jgi:hypothetical protein
LTDDTHLPILQLDAFKFMRGITVERALAQSCDYTSNSRHLVERIWNPRNIGGAKVRSGDHTFPREQDGGMKDGQFTDVPLLYQCIRVVLHFHSSNAEMNSPRGIVLRMVLTALNTSIGSPNVDPSNFLFSVPNS